MGRLGEERDSGRLNQHLYRLASADLLNLQDNPFYRYLRQT